MDATDFFAREWPLLVPKLRAALAGAGAPTADLDDLAQETAVRLLTVWGSIDWSRPLEPLARQVALNAWRDQWRRRGSREILGQAPERTASADTERAALARVEVTEVSHALARLPQPTASVLRLAAAQRESGDPRKGVTSTVRMARSRARCALVAHLRVAPES